MTISDFLKKRLFILFAAWFFPTAAVAETFEERNQVVSMEAEHYTNKQGFFLRKKADLAALAAKDSAIRGKTVTLDASRQAMQVDDNLGEGQGRLRFKVTLKHGGRWKIYVRTYALDDKQNSLRIRVDGGQLVAPKDSPNAGQKRIFLTHPNKFVWNSMWQGLVHGGRSGPVTWDATPGTHTIVITKDLQKADPVIDKIVLVRASSGVAEPTGKGPAETAIAGGSDAGVDSAAPDDASVEDAAALDAATLDVAARDATSTSDTAPEPDASAVDSADSAEPDPDSSSADSFETDNPDNDGRLSSGCVVGAFNRGFPAGVLGILLLGLVCWRRRR